MRAISVFKNIALMCFLLFIGQANQLFAQSDSVPYELPLSTFKNPFFTPASGLYLNTPSVLNPKVSYDAETEIILLNNQLKLSVKQLSYLSLRNLKNIIFNKG